MIRRACSVIAVALVLLVVTAAPAMAHAQLQSNDPVNNARLSVAPTSVTVRFSEEVQITSGSMRVFDTSGKRVDTGTAEHPDGDPAAVRAPLRALPDGGYVVTWRVVSSDSHPVHGAFTFQVGEGNIDTTRVSQQVLNQSNGDRAVGVTFGVVRAVMFAALTLVVGAAFFQLFVAEPSRRLAMIANVTLFVATLLSIPLQALYASGLSFGRLDWSVVSGSLDSPYGHGALARLLICVAVAAFSSRARVFAALALALVVSLAVQGHARTGRYPWLGFSADVLHVASASAWVGGLLFLVFALRHANKFSRLALWAVVALVVSGFAQGWRQLGSLDALTGTPYGRILLVKVGIVAVMIGLGWLARRGLGRMAKTKLVVTAEVGLAVAVFAATSLLVNAAPASSENNKPFSGELTVGTNLVDVVVDPARAGTNAVHLYVLTKTGLPVDVEEVTASLALPDRDVAPVPVPLQRAGLGHYASYAFTVPLSGNWILEANLRTTDININTNNITVPIR
jgi:copper transport protein